MNSVKFIWLVFLEYIILVSLNMYTQKLKWVMVLHDQTIQGMTIHLLSFNIDSSVLVYLYSTAVLVSSNLGSVWYKPWWGMITFMLYCVLSCISLYAFTLCFRSLYTFMYFTVCFHVILCILLYTLSQWLWLGLRSDWNTSKIWACASRWPQTPNVTMTQCHAVENYNLWTPPYGW